MLVKIPIVTFVSSFALMIPLLLGVIKANEVIKTPLKIILLYIIIYTVFEIVAWYYVFNGFQNHFLGNTIVYFDIIFFGWYYYSVLSNQIQKKIVLCLILVSISIILWSHFGTDRDYNRIDSFALSIENITVIAMALIFFYQLLNTLEVKNLFTYSHFWIGIAILIYFSIVFFMDIFAEYIAFNKDESIIQYWQIKEYLTFFHRIFLAIGLWFSTTPIQSNLSSK